MAGYILKGFLNEQSLEFILKPGIHIIGRSSDNNIQVNERSVSRHHAELIFDQGVVTINDLGSINGTWINGEKIEKKRELKPGDEILLGKVSLIIASDDSGILLSRQTMTLCSEPEEIREMERLGNISFPDSTPVMTIDSLLFHALIEAGKLLIPNCGIENAISQIMDLIEETFSVDRVLLLLIEFPGGQLEIKAARFHGVDENEKLILSRDAIECVIQKRDALLMNSTEEMAAEDCKGGSAMAVPLFDDTKVIGLLYAEKRNPEVYFTHNELSTFSHLACLLALKISKHRNNKFIWDLG